MQPQAQRPRRARLAALNSYAASYTAGTATWQATPQATPGTVSTRQGKARLSEDSHGQTREILE